MSAKQIAYGEQARFMILEGLEKAFKCIKPTIGPTSKNVILDKKFGKPQSVDNAVAITKEIEFKDPFESMGAKLLNSACEKTSDKCGDGTAITATLLQAIYKNSLKYLIAGANPVLINNGLVKAMNCVTSELDKISRPADKREIYEHIATIATGYNKELGKIVADAVEKAGKEGIINVEEGKGAQTILEFTQGTQFDKGYISPYFITNVDKLTCELEDAFILLYDKKIANVQEIVPLLEEVAQLGKPLLIVAEDVEGEALATLVINKLNGVLSVCAVKAPGFGDRRKNMLQDIAILTGGNFISEDLGKKLENVKIKDLGRAEKIIVEKEKTSIIGGKGSKEKIDKRAAQIRKQIAETTSNYDREKLQERLAKITAGVATIKVGAATESAMKELKVRVENAVNSTKSAREEGITYGGGVAYLRTIPALEKLEASGDEKIGIDILKEALKQVAYNIAENAGHSGSVVVSEIMNGVDDFGFDAKHAQFGKMMEKDIIDPVKVLKVALQNAVSIAKLMLSSETLITELKKKEEQVEGSVA